MKQLLVMIACACFVCESSSAQMGRHGGGERVNVQNRSAGSVNRGGNQSFNGANNANVNRNYNNNTNVNRNTNVNQNVNVNRNVNVNTNYNYHGGGCYNCGGGYYNDGGYSWGSFAAGAAVGVATTAAVAAATRPATTVVVQAPALGTMVPALPGGCSTINTGGAMIYNCSSVYYRPYYQGTTLVYQVVTYP